MKFYPTQKEVNDNLKFPLSFLSKGLTNDSIHNILFYTVYKLSLLVDYNMETICKHTLSNYYDNFHDHKINKLIKKLDLKHVGKQPEDNRYKRKEIDELMKVFRKYHGLKESAVEIYQINTVLKHYNLEGWIEKIQKIGKKQYGKVDGLNQHMIKIDIEDFMDFRNGYLLNKRLTV